MEPDKWRLYEDWLVQKIQKNWYLWYETAYSLNFSHLNEHKFGHVISMKRSIPCATRGANGFKSLRLKCLDIRLI